MLLNATCSWALESEPLLVREPSEGEISAVVYGSNLISAPLSGAANNN